MNGSAAHASIVVQKWFAENKRDFPWRSEKTPYRVWISEVMLQQTRAAVVIPYFLRWMDLFPDVKALYNASPDQVIKAWEGLGYYSRARNLHAAAKQIMGQFGGEIPSNKEALQSIRGFGPYTVGALLSFAFHQKAAAVDGNVVRVVSRYFCIEENVGKSSVRKKIAEKTESLLGDEAPWITMEALIELGALVCTVKPRCEACPLRDGCQAFLQGQAEHLPIKNIEKTITELHRTVFVFEHEGFVRVQKGAAGKVMAGLYEFPYVEGRKSARGRKLTEQKHTFTRYRAHLFPYLIKVPVREGSEWVRISALAQLPFSSGHRKIADEIQIIYDHLA